MGDEPAGDGRQVEPGVPHRMFDHSARPVEFLVASPPHRHGEREVVE